MFRLLLLILLAASSVRATACEWSEYAPSPQQREQDALDHYRHADFVYEGLVVGAHDFNEGGRFLVLRSIKGPAKTFNVIAMPGGSSCYEGVGAFSTGVWAGNDNIGSFDQFEPDKVIEIWKRHGLMSADSMALRDAKWISLMFLLLVTVGGTVWIVRAKRKRTTRPKTSSRL